MTKQNYEVVLRIFNEIKSNKDSDIQKWVEKTQMLKDLEFLLGKGPNMIIPCAEYEFHPNT